MKRDKNTQGNIVKLNEPKALQRLLFIDGIHYSILMIRLAYGRLQSELLALSRDYDNKSLKGVQALSEEERTAYIVSAMSNAWNIIDLMHKLIQLLSKTPNLKQNRPELQLFYRRTKRIEQFRNSIQHLNEEITNYVKDKVPSWGTLNWVAKLDESTDFVLFSLMPGDIFERATPLTNPIGKEIEIPIGLITLCLKSEICLSDLIGKYLRDVVAFLQSFINYDFVDKPQYALMALEFKENPNQ